MAPQKLVTEYKFSEGNLIHDKFARIPVNKLRSVVARIGNFIPWKTRSRAEIYECIEQSEPTQQHSIVNGVLEDSERDINDYTFSQGESIHEAFAPLSVENLQSIVVRLGRFTTSRTRTRAAIYECIEGADDALQISISDAVLNELGKGKGKFNNRKKRARSATELNTARKRANNSVLTGRSSYTSTSMDVDPIASTSSSVHHPPMQASSRPYDTMFDTGDASRSITPTDLEPTALPTSSQPENTVPSLEARVLEQLLISDFMQAPSPAIIRGCLERFIDETNNAAVDMCCCACCAREWNCEDVTEVKINEIPNKSLLSPDVPHPKHDLFDGALLYPPAILTNDTAVICSECLRHLKAKRKPKLSLANGTWIGEIPPELAKLTLPERMLIAKYYPAAYIIKLYPKSPGSRNWQSNQLHKGLRGNVSTYMLDPKLAVSLVEGRIMPPRSGVLSATIGITFISPKGLPENKMPRIFRVRRERVRKALIWLKEHNPLYSDIEISEDRLQALPINGIPEEILAATKYSQDIDAVYAEHASYVPDQVDSDQETDGKQSQQAFQEAGLIEVPDDLEDDIDTAPAVLPLNSLGVVDVDGVAITDQELMSHALANAAQQTPPEDFQIRHGSAFMNEYARTNEDGLRNDGGSSNPNHLLGCFPTLFPYGQGGFEVYRTIDIPYEVHVRWALAYADRRFRLDHHFPFQVFGVCQKRQVCRSAVLQIKKSAFARQFGAISQLTANDFLEASKQETQGIPFTNPAIRALRKQLSAIRTRVAGTDESRVVIRSKIWGMNLVYNPPSLWVTINPADSQDPIAQVLAGIAIDLNKFCDTAGPDSEQRATNIASDPYASAKFFHFLIETILTCLFGIRKKREGCSNPEGGILGQVQGYIGTVEAQGRGTLHLHMLLWLKDAPSSTVMEAALHSDAFRQKIKSYIKTVIRADVDKLDHEAVLAIPKEPAISYSRTLDPRKCEQSAIIEQEKKLARAVQLHKCNRSTCLKVIQGIVRCKRRAPFKTAEDDWVESNGEWGPRRFCGYFNNWNPTLLNAIRSNHDIKLILNGGMTKAVTWYITNYATKKQQRSSNITAVLAKKFAFHRNTEKQTKDIRTANKKLIQRCANALTSCHEFSAPEIMSYLMGWGDHYESHTFAAIYWDSVMITLKRVFPDLNYSNHSFGVNPDAAMSNVGENSDEPVINAESTNGEPNVIIAVDSESNQVHLKDQLKDYQYRGDALEHMSLYDFVIETYDFGITSMNEADAADENDNSNTNTGHPGRGRPCNQRVPYRAEAAKPKRCRIVRSPGHDTIPRIVGKWFPRSDDPAWRKLYCASMAVLLKPWRAISDLRRPGETFEGNWAAYSANLTERQRRVVDNIQYFHECADSARERKQAEADSGGAADGIEYKYEADEEEEPNTDDNGNANEYTGTLTEEDVEWARMTRLAEREQIYGRSGIQIATEVGFFPEEESQTSGFLPVAPKAEYDDLPMIQGWAKQLKDTTRRIHAETGMADITSTSIGPSIQLSAGPMEETRIPEDHPTSNSHIPDIIPNVDTVPITDDLVARPKFHMLNYKQRIAHDIVERTLRAELSGNEVDQLKMLILGQGGTGKSLLIGAITETFEYLQAQNLLAKTATSGIAASEIKAQTLHSWAGIATRIPQDDDDLFSRSTKATTAARARNIHGKSFLIIDEISMADKATLYMASQIVHHVKSAEGTALPGPFGGTHSILTGDFHQFPPVANPLGALYQLLHSKKDIRRSQLGRELYQSFETVVILKDQVRIQDETWIQILSRLRVGECTDEDIAEIRKLVLTNPECDVPDFTTAPWNEAILVTPRHSVREMWNAASLKKHCQSTGHRRYIVQAEDMMHPSDTPVPINVRVKIASMPEKSTCRLRDVVEIAVGMKAMVVLNLATEADIANGTRGTITDIRLDPREEISIGDDDDEPIKLKYPPALVLFRPDCGTDIVFPGLPQGVVPITPSVCTFKVQNGKLKHSIRRRQLAITAGYAFTDYKSQGQTIEYVIIDIGKPPSGTLSPFSTYVALSRSRGRNTIRLLRDFDEELFTIHPSEALRLEMQRLEELDMITERELRIIGEVEVE